MLKRGGKVDIEDLKIHLDSRIDSIEELIKLLVVSSVIEQIDAVQVPLENENLIDFINDINLNLIKKESFGEYTLVYLSSDLKIGLKEIRTLNVKLKITFEKVIPVFVVEKLSGIQKKKMTEEKISYLIKNKELHVVI